MEINKITYDEIKELWDLLWWDKYYPKSGVILLEWGKRDASIHENYDIEVSFFGAYINDKLVGVNSGFCPCEFQYRSRGLYVLPEYRRQGIATKLLDATEEQGRKEGRFIIWSVPRKEALSTYKKYGFLQLSNFFKGTWGENCFVMKSIKK